MIEKIILSKKNIKDYKSVAGAGVINQLKKNAKSLKGKRIIHINSTPRGGGVAEILNNLVPLERSLGINASWFSFKAPKRFFKITKKIHNALQGEKINLSVSEKKFYLNINKKLAKELNKIPADLFIIHDPQPLAIILSFNNKPMVARIHLDLSAPNKKVFSLILPILRQYRKIIISLKEFIPKGINKSKVSIIPPAIDPLDAKHVDISKKKARKILSKFGVNFDKPLISQVSRFDPWKDPLGVIDAYYLAKKKIPDLQLILLGLFLEQDDPQAKVIFEKVKKKAKGNSDIFLFSNPKILKDKKISNNTFVNAVQRGSDLILQKSIKEGFGLTATEAMWKSKTVIGGTAYGLKLQIQNNKTGFIVKNSQEAAQKIVKLLNDKSLRRKIGQQAHLSVKKKYLITRLLNDHLKLYKTLIDADDS
ncbi:MAG TPA: glycosyltransferase [Candidatus Wolfebacteria bacterium]|nr:glycosyltransferase [Candidatus Wolfebacteria bacterium]